MNARNALALAAAALFGASLAGCGTVSKLDPFHKDTPAATSKAAEGERIPLIALNQKLEVSDALKGQSFFLPDPQPVPAWPQPIGTPDQWIDNLASAPDFKVAWSHGFGDGSNRKLHLTAPPVGADGRIYVMDAEAHVSAFDAKSGARVWRVDLADRSNKHDREAFGGGLAFNNGRLFVTSGYRFIAALDPATGKVIWRTNVDSPIHGAPAVANGRVLAINVDDELEAYSADTGAQDWTYQALTEPARILKASSPTPAGDAVVAPFASGELVALHTANGNEEWNVTLSRTSRTNALSEIRDIAGRPVVYGQDVLAGSHSGVFMNVDLRSGESKWALPITTIDTPWPAGDVVFVVSQAGQVICASRENGQVYWITDLNQTPDLDAKHKKNEKKTEKKKKEQRTLFFGPVLASGRLIVVSDKGQAVALDPKTGAVTSTLKLGAPALMGPIAMNGELYVVTDKAELVAIR
jgi:outer membrane protein assembly factor BamB